MNLRQWHHAFLGLIIVGLSYLFDLDAIYHIVGWFILVDDLIQHWMQGVQIHHIELDYLEKHNILGVNVRVDKNKIIFEAFGGVDEYKLFHFFLHTLMYKYFKIQRFKIVNRITEIANGVFK